MDHKNIDPEVILGDYDPEVLTGEGQLGMSDATDDAPTDWKVVGPAATLVLVVILWGLITPNGFAQFASNALSWIVNNLGWMFVLFGTVFVFYILSIAFSRFGAIRLGRDDEEPEFSTPSWIAMMFAAGMGIGLMFYGTTEPLTFYRDGVPGSTPKDLNSAFASTLFHWTLHPWAIYAIVGLAIAYATFRMGRKQLLSSAFIPLIGAKRAEGWVGKVIDILAIFATVFGTAASLGLGALQIGSGLDDTGIIHNPGTPVLVGVVIVLSVCFLASAASGVGKGIQYISNANMILAAILGLFVLIVGPTVVILNMIPTAFGSYVQQFFEMAARTADTDNGKAGKWLGTWTIFYWAWWVSWSPFVGMFIARISRGRTIREFVGVVLLVPSAITVCWFSIFGGTAVHLEGKGHSIWGDGDATHQLFSLLTTMPAGQAFSILAMVLLATFFITSADSASTVMGSMSQSGRIVADVRVTCLWGVLTAIIGIVLLVSGGSDALNNLQSVTIIAASPFLLIIIGLMFALVKGFREDPVYLDHREQRRFALKLARERRVEAAHLARRRRRRAERARGKERRSSPSNDTSTAATTTT